MSLRKPLFLAVIAALLAAGHGLAASPRTLDARVGKADIEDGKLRAAILSGASHGILPGDRGFFLKDGVKVSGSEFEIDRVGDRVAWTAAPFPTLDAMRWRTSLEVKVTTTRTCAPARAKPQLDSRSVLLGRTPPRGFTFATVTSSAKTSDSSITFRIDKGSDDGVMPSSYAYAVHEGSGVPMPIAVDVTWVSRTSAGGVVRGVARPEEALDAVRKLGVEKVRCSG